MDNNSASKEDFQKGDDKNIFFSLHEGNNENLHTMNQVEYVYFI